MRVEKTGARERGAVCAVCGVECVVCVAVVLWTQSPDADYLVAHKIVSIKKPDLQKAASMHRDDGCISMMHRHRDCNDVADTKTRWAVVCGVVGEPKPHKPCEI